MATYMVTSTSKSPPLVLKYCYKDVLLNVFHIFHEFFSLVGMEQCPKFTWSEGPNLLSNVQIGIIIIATKLII